LAQRIPPQIGVSTTYSPQTIIAGTNLDLKKHCKLPFGAYIEAHKEYPQTKTIAERNHGVICIGPTDNFQGSYKMLCIRTGRPLTRKQFTELPMPDSVIKRIEAREIKEKQDKVITFTYRNDDTIPDDTDDNKVIAGVENDDDDDTRPDVDNDPPGIALENNMEAQDPEPEVDHKTK
jgi:hypothetical protein